MHTCTLVHTIALYRVRFRRREEVSLASHLHGETKLGCFCLFLFLAWKNYGFADAAVAYICTVPDTMLTASEKIDSASCRAFEHCLVHPFRDIVELPLDQPHLPKPREQPAYMIGSRIRKD